MRGYAGDDRAMSRKGIICGGCVCFETSMKYTLTPHKRLRAIQGRRTRRLRKLCVRRTCQDLTYDKVGSL